jgi:hypothetical protein
MLILVRTNNYIGKKKIVFLMINQFNHLNHKKINVKHMVFKRELKFHIKVEGLGFGHYNICVNFKF